jgi:hypothetical protein
MALSREHVEAALNEIDQRGIPVGRRSKHWCLSSRGRHYPPKYVVGLAHAHEPHGHEWRPDEHYGGESAANTTLRKLGYGVIPHTCRNHDLPDFTN